MSLAMCARRRSKSQNEQWGIGGGFSSILE